MPEYKWIDRSQPQTLQSAVLFCYVLAATGVIGCLLFGAPPWLFFVLVLPIPAYFVANEKRVAYFAAIALAFLLLIAQLVVIFSYPGVLISMLFTVALIALFLHPQSREYQKIWFR